MFIGYLLIAKGFPGGTSDKKPVCQGRTCRRCGFNPWVGTKEGRGEPVQYSRLENPVDRGTWQATVHRGAQSRSRLT